MWVTLMTASVTCPTGFTHPRWRSEGPSDLPSFEKPQDHDRYDYSTHSADDDVERFAMQAKELGHPHPQAGTHQGMHQIDAHRRRAEVDQPR